MPIGEFCIWYFLSWHNHVVDKLNAKKKKARGTNKTTLFLLPENASTMNC
jgi:hypothetical protein